jgi:tRNA dimethylallyltransferase
VAFTYRVLTGPTAAGKTAWLLNLAGNRKLNVISADSRQVYRNMDIGTGKPARTDREILPHFGLDLLEPGIIFSVYQYLIVAANALAESRAQGREVWVCGGTGLYIRALIQQMDLGAPPRPRLRAALQALLAARPSRALAQELGLQLAEPDNPRRVVRAAELACADSADAERIYAAAGLDAACAAADVSRGGGLPQSVTDELSRWRCAGLAVLDPGKVELARLIEQRVRGMFGAGLVEEVAQLRRLGYGGAQVVAQGIGYREAGQVLDGALGLEGAVSLTITRTRQYAKRQRTYFRGQGWQSYTRDELDAWAVRQP